MTQLNCVNCHTPIPENSKFCLECGADLSDPGSGTRTNATERDLSVRLAKATEGRYKLDKMVGRGGMGAVFLAQDLTLERPVAIKVLPPDVSNDENLIGRFEREARTAAKLDHPNIIPIFAVQSVGDVHYFVMKYVSGQPLDEVLRGGRLPLDQAVTYLWEAARALGHAHQRDVVHRDIKPANMMVDHDGRLMLADFGISKAMQSATQHTSTGQVIGTPHYMSPEQAKGLVVDGRSDQYSLAVVAYQMIAGRLPFADDSVHTVIYKHLFEDPVPLAEHHPSVPPFVATAIHRALAKEPEQRYPTMEDFANAVAPDRRLSVPVRPRASSADELVAITEAPTEITGSSSTEVRTIEAPRKKRGGLRAAVMVLMLLGGGAGGVWAWQEGMLDRWLPPTQVAQQLSSASPGPEAAQPVTSDTTAGSIEDDSPEGSSDSSTATPPAPVQVQTAPPQPRPNPPVQRRPPRPVQAEPDPVPQLGSLRVGSNLYGSVYVDDVYVGVTPLDHDLGPGSHVVKITRDGCQDIVDTVTVSLGRRSIVNKIFRCGSS